jgi:hypothetical protein
MRKLFRRSTKRLNFESLETRRMLACDRLDGGEPLSVPAYSSLPSAEKKMFLDFDGDIHRNWGSWADLFGTSTNGPIPPYDVDGDTSCFSQHELENMRSIYEIVKEKFSPFQIDITTVDPLSLEDGRAGKVVIGGDGAWYGRGGGVAYGSGFYGPGENVGYVWHSPHNTRYVGEAVAHEAGHMLGLKHQSLYDGETLVNEYRRELIMGRGDANTPGGRWAIGTSTGIDSFDGSIDRDSSPQDDIAKLQSEGLALRPDEVGNSIATATPLELTEFGFEADGLLERETDVDFFSINSIASGTRLTIRVRANEWAPMLDPRLEVYTVDGTLVGSSETAGVYDETVVIESSIASSYFIAIRSAANPEYAYSLGQYSVDVAIGQETDDSPVTATRLVGISEVAPDALGTLGLTWGRHVISDFVSEQDVWDWYVIKPQGPGQATVRLNPLAADVNLYVFNYYNSRADRILFGGTQPGTAAESFSFDILNAPAGFQYLIGVQHFAGTGTGYTLDVNIDNRRAELCTCNVIPTREYWPIYGYVNSGDTDPIVASLEWRPLQYAINATLTAYSTPVDLRVGYDLNRNGVINADELIESRFVPANSPMRIVDYALINADRRALILEVHGRSGSNTNYELRFATDWYRPSLDVPLADLGIPLSELGLTRHEVQLNDELSVESPREFIDLGILPAGPVHFEIQQDGQAIVDYQVIHDVNQDGKIDASEIVATGREMKFEVKPGDTSPYYFSAMLNPQSNVLFAPYQLHFRNAITLGIEGTDPKLPRRIAADKPSVLHGLVRFSEDASDHRPTEYYAVEVSKGGQLNLKLSPESSSNSQGTTAPEVRVAIGQDNNQNGLIEPDEQIMSRIGQLDATLELGLLADAGNYLMTVQLMPGEVSSIESFAFDYRIDNEMVEPTDTTPVTIESAESIGLGELTAFQITFSEDIAGSFQTDEILVRAKATNEPADIEEWLYLPEQRTLVGIMSPAAAAGEYEVAIDAGAVADLLGNRLAESFQFQFEIEPIPVNRIPGDANLDDVFNSADLIQVFQFGEYEDDTPNNSTWAEGDWNQDGDFDTSDLVLAFQTGSYSASSRGRLSLDATAAWAGGDRHRRVPLL